MLIRDYKASDAVAIVRLFYETVRSVNLKDYSAEQVQAWASQLPDPELWHARMSQRCTLVAEEAGEVIAFAELESDGCLDMFFCRKDFIGHGVGQLLYRAIEAQALSMGLLRIFAEVSITARSFFEHCGFSVCRQQTVTRNGVELSNFQMEKYLIRSPS
jgi:GNAT superfamily N-acetyltransferase